MRIALLLLVLGLVAGASNDDARVFVGKLLTVSPDNIKLSQGDSVLLIGFVGDPAALAGLDGVKVGEEVRAVFGSTTRPGSPGRINKLLSIRRCAKYDEQCAADRRAQEAKAAESEKAYALLEAEFTQCHRKMEDTLLKDTRYAPTLIEMSEPQSEALVRQVNALTDKRKKCANAVIHDHQAAVLEACELHHCGDNVGGGCDHIAGNSTSDAVFEQALAICTVDNLSQLRGHYTWGHEVETFRPCGSAQTFWVTGDMAVLQPLRDKSAAVSQAQGRPYQPIFVEASGVAEGKATDGFAADYDGVYRFTRVRFADGLGATDCEAHDEPSERM